MTRKKKHRNAAKRKTEEGEKREGGVPQADDKFIFQMSCRPNGSKLNKPTDFFTKFFAVCAEDSDKKISFENVQFLKNDVFLFQSSKKHRRAVQELQSRGEREYAAKTVKVMCIQNMRPNPDSKTSTVEEGGCVDGRVVRVVGDISSVGMDKLRFYVKSEESGGGMIEVDDLKADPATITLCKREAAYGLVERGVHTINGISVSFILNHPEAEYQNSGLPNDLESGCTVEIGGSVKDIWSDVLVTYFQNKNTSGGGKIKEQNLNKSPPTVTFVEREAAKRVVEKKTHVVDGRVITVRFPGSSSQEPEEKKEERIVVKKRHCVDETNSSIQLPNTASETGNVKETNAVKVNNEKDVEIHGELDKIGQDTLLMYLENERRSGGGEIEKYDFDCSPATVTFCNSKVAEKVVGKGKHCIDSKKFFVEFPKAAAETRNAEETNAAEKNNEKDVEILGELEKIGQETLLLYLESRKGSGGGEIEKHDFYCSPATVTFCSAEDAERVVRKGKHCIDNKEFFVEFPKTAAETRNAEETNAAEKNNEKDVEIHGDLDKIGQDTLLMYLENKRRSGGGEIEKFDFNCSPATVTFCSAEDAERVVRKGKHCIDNKEFFVEFPKTAAETRNAEETNAAEKNNEKDVEIHGELDKIGQETLLLYLESRKGSGGGEIEKFDFNCSPATVTFCSAEAAKRVVSKPGHKVDKNVFKVMRPTPKSPVQFLPNTILISNLHKETRFEHLKLYIDKLCGAEPADVLYSHDKTAAMATLPEEIDWAKVSEIHTKRPALNDNMLKVERVQEPDSIFVSNIPENITKDHLLLKLEKVADVECDFEMNYEREQGFAIVKCNDLEAISTLKKKKVELSGQHLAIELFFPKVIPDHVWSLIHKKPAEVLVEADHLVINHILQNHKKEICTALKSEVYKKTEHSANGQQKLVYFAFEKQTAESERIVIDFCKQFSIEKCPSKFGKDIKAEINSKNYDVAVEVDQSGQSVLVGKKEHVQNLIRFVEKMSNEVIETEHIIELPNQKIDVLMQHGFLQKLAETMMLKMKRRNNQIGVKGKEHMLMSFETKVAIKIGNINESFESVSSSIFKLLEDDKGHKSVVNLMKKCNIRLIFSPDTVKTGVRFYALETSDLKNGIEIFKQHVTDLPMDLKSTDVSLLKSKEGVDQLDMILSKHLVHIELREDKILFTGVDEICLKATNELKAFLTKHAYRKKTLPLTKGRARALFSIYEEERRRLETAFSGREVTISLSRDECCIVITGRGDSAIDVVRKLTDLSNELQQIEFIMQRPGLLKVIEAKTFKRALSSIENVDKVVIINADEDKAGSVQDEEIEKEYAVISSSLICQLKLVDGKALCVYEGDITDHECDAIVNPANERLWLGSGVAGAIRSQGGQTIQDECDKLVQEYGELNEGEVATTSAGRLKNTKNVIHAVGPRWPVSGRSVGEKELEHRTKACKEILFDTMKNVLEEADKQDCLSVAVPAISSGIYGFPKDLCAELLTKAASTMMINHHLKRLREVHFINNDAVTVTSFHKTFSTLFRSKPEFEDFGQPKVSLSHVRGNLNRKFVHESNFPGKSSSEGGKNILLNKDRKRALSGLRIEIEVGDLAKVKADVIVNSTSSDLVLSKNPSANSLSKAAGPTLQQACTSHVAENGNVPEYQFAVTKGGNLKCQWVFHAVCASYQGAASEQDLEKFIASLLDEAVKKNAETLAMPALGTGKLGFPRDKVARIMIQSAQEFGSKMRQNCSLKKVLLVAFHSDTGTIQALEQAMGDPYLATPTSSTPLAAKPESVSTIGESVKKAAIAQESVNVLDLEGSAIKLGKTIIEIDHGDITEEKADAIVVIGNETLDFMGAVGNAIIQKEGRKFKSKAKKYSPQDAGTTCLIKTNNMPSNYVAHIYPRSDMLDDLREGTKELLLECDRKDVKTISLPAIGTGILGKKPKESANLILSAFVELCMADKVKNIAHLRIIIFERDMVDVFKEQMFNMVANPEKYLHDENKGLIDWIKEKYSIVKELFWNPKNKVKGAAREQYRGVTDKTNPLKMVTWHIYGRDTKALKSTEKEVRKLVEENITTNTVKNDLFAKLSEDRIEKIKAYTARNDVLLELEKDSGSMKLTGFYSDVANVLGQCHAIAFENEKVQQEKNMEQSISNYVQWKERGDDGTVINYDPKLNRIVEKAYQSKEKERKIDMEDNGTVSEFSLDFESMKVRNVKSGQEMEIIREELGDIKTTVKLPGNWKPMTKKSDGTEMPVTTVKLSPSCKEYTDILSLFQATCPSISVVEIQRIQNPHLFKSFMARKESMEKTAGGNTANEKKLFHGTSGDAVEQINETGFNRSFAGINGVLYGNGVYFARDASYSNRYAAPDARGRRHMFLARVLTGKYCVGQNGIKVPPKGFDSVVDQANPSIHVVFYDNQCYPEYLIIF